MLVMGLSYDAADFRQGGNQFTAAAMKLRLGIVESEGTKPIPPRYLLIPGPELDAQCADYDRRMLEWRSRRAG